MTKRVNEVLSIMEDYFTNYLPFVKGLSSNTIKSYQYAFQLLFKYLEAEKNISPEQISFQALSGDTIPDFLLYLEQERGCSIHTRNLRRSAIVSFAKFASKKAFVSSLSFYTDVIDLPVKRQPKQLGVKYFTKDEIAALLTLPNTSKLIGQRDVTLLSLLYASGARAQEICDLTLADISFNKPTTIRLHGKGNKSRIVVIPNRCSAILKEYISSRNLDCSSANAKNIHVFPSQTHNHMTISCVEGIVKKYVSQAKKQYPLMFTQKGYSPHSFRHSIAVHMLEAGDSLLAIKAFLGHSSLMTTAVYAQVSPELANKYLDSRGKPLPEDCNLRTIQPLELRLPFLYHR